MKTTGMFYEAPHKVRVKEFEIGDPAPNEAQVEVKVSGLCAYDLAIFEGFTPSGYAFPFLHGHEGVGIVLTVGANVAAVKVGDKVAMMGNASRLNGHVANVTEDMLARLPDDAGDLQDWLAEPVACVVNSLEWNKLVPGDRVALVGTGFMGLLFVQGLRYSLAQEVIAIDIDERRLVLAREMGATQTINPLTDEGKQAIAELKRNPLDVVIECGGAQATLDLATQLVRPAGRLNIFGSHRGSGTRAVDIYDWHRRGIEVVNTSPKSAPDFARVFRRTVGLMQKGVFDLKPLISHVAAPEDAQELFEMATARKNEYLKGVMVWKDGD